MGKQRDPNANAKNKNKLRSSSSPDSSLSSLLTVRNVLIPILLLFLYSIYFTSTLEPIGPELVVAKSSGGEVGPHLLPPHREYTQREEGTGLSDEADLRHYEVTAPLSPGSLVTSYHNTLPKGLLDDVIADGTEMARSGASGSKNSIVYRVGSPTEFGTEQALNLLAFTFFQSLKELHPSKKPPSELYAEYWFTKVPGDRYHSMKFDVSYDDFYHRLNKTLAHPLVSSELYLSSAGAPTVILNQTLDKKVMQVQEMHVSFPAINKYSMHRGDVVKGSVGELAREVGGDRFYLNVDWWDGRTFGKPYVNDTTFVKDVFRKRNQTETTEVIKAHMQDLLRINQFEEHDVSSVDIRNPTKLTNGNTYKLHWDGLRLGVTYEMVLEVLNKYADIDVSPRDGGVTLEELKKVVMTDNVYDVFEEGDINGDGVMSWQEFVKSFLA
jgi:hypothetical protein